MPPAGGGHGRQPGQRRRPRPGAVRGADASPGQLGQAGGQEDEHEVGAHGGGGAPLRPGRRRPSAAAPSFAAPARAQLEGARPEGGVEGDGGHGRPAPAAAPATQSGRAAFEEQGGKGEDHDQPGDYEASPAQEGPSPSP